MQYVMYPLLQFFIIHFVCVQFEEWEEKIRAVQAKAAIAAEEESVVSSEAASEPRPAKRGRPKKRSESSSKKVG